MDPSYQTLDTHQARTTRDTQEGVHTHQHEAVTQEPNYTSVLALQMVYESLDALQGMQDLVGPDRIKMWPRRPLLLLYMLRQKQDRI
jgi:hypothetical protein